MISQFCKTVSPWLQASSPSVCVWPFQQRHKLLFPERRETRGRQPRLRTFCRRSWYSFGSLSREEWSEPQPLADSSWSQILRHLAVSWLEEASCSNWTHNNWNITTSAFYTISWEKIDRFKKFNTKLLSFHLGLWQIIPSKNYVLHSISCAKQFINVGGCEAQIVASERPQSRSASLKVDHSKNWLQLTWKSSLDKAHFNFSSSYLSWFSCTTVPYKVSISQ